MSQTTRLAKSGFLPRSRERGILYSAGFTPLELRRRSNIFRVMFTLDIKGDWDLPNGRLKQEWAKHTDSDLSYAAGKQKELLDRIQQSVGETREAVEKVIKEFCK